MREMAEFEKEVEIERCNGQKELENDADEGLVACDLSLFSPFSSYFLVPFLFLSLAEGIERQKENKSSSTV